CSSSCVSALFAILGGDHCPTARWIGGSGRLTVAPLIVRRTGQPRRYPERMATARSKPAFIPPMLATLVAAPFDDPGWQFEIKWDGFRVEAIVDGKDVRLWTRGQQDAA